MRFTGRHDADCQLPQSGRRSESESNTDDLTVFAREFCPVPSTYRSILYEQCVVLLVDNTTGLQHQIFVILRGYQKSLRIPVYGTV